MYNMINSPRWFKDPVSGMVTKKNELCLEDEKGNFLHLSQLPARRLIPLKQYLNGQCIAVQGNKGRI
jgi:hypothetical protein